jgi:hypothetical protein
VPFNYSDNLINEAIQCFKIEHGMDITREQANDYLNAFAELYLAFMSKSRPITLVEDGIRNPDNALT